MRHLLEPHEDVVVAGEAPDVDTALELTKFHHPDAVFLDVQLRGETAFDYVGRLDGHQPRIVFVTAHDSYAVRGFECNAFDYLLKPVLPERLGETLERIRQQRLQQRPVAVIEDSVFIRFDRTARLVPWQEISHIETHGNYTKVLITDGSSSLVLRPLKEWFALFPRDGFIQVHRSAVVRVNAIREIRFLDGGKRELMMISGEAIAVSRSHWAALKAAIVHCHPEAANIFR